MKQNKHILEFILSFLALSACGPSSLDVSEHASFEKVLTFNLPSNKIDILFVIDNSPKMAGIQQNLINAFPTFLQELSSKGVDYQIGVGTTEAFLEKYEGVPYTASLSTGTSGNNSGVSVITNTTLDPAGVFAINANVGELGHSDERGLESFRDIYKKAANSTLFRPGSHLAVIFVTNEDDFSHEDGVDCYGTCGYNALDDLYSEVSPGVYESIFKYYSKENPNPFTGSYLESVESFNDLLRRDYPDWVRQKMYSFHSYSIHDHACRLSQNEADTEFKGRLIAKRYSDLIDLSGGGAKQSICAVPTFEVKKIAQNIIDQNFKVYLPPYSTYIPFKLYSGGTEVLPLDSSGNGYSIEPESFELRFFGDSVPNIQAELKLEYQVK